MENLLKVISKDYLEKLNIIASEEDNKQSTEVESKETDVDEKPVTDVEIGEMLEEETEQQEEIKKDILESNNNDDATSELNTDKEEYKSESQRSKEVNQPLKDWKNPYNSDYESKPGEWERWFISRLKKLKERIFKRLSQTEEGDTNE